MNFIFEITRYIFFLIIGIILIEWYIKKKGWENSISKSLIYVFTWKTIMLFIYLGIDFIIDPEAFFYSSIIMLLISFFINIFLAIIFFKLIFKQKIIESIVIILIIVIIEIILESFLLYTILIPESLISSFNL